MADALGKTFLLTGAEYDRYRPGFPAAAVDAVLPSPVETALDLGAGTGKLTERLVERSQTTTAVDPSESMLAELRRKLPHVQALVGTAEDIPFANDSQDAVTVAQAFHWFDRKPACAEIVRVLRPGGRLGLMWNGPDPDCAWDLACHEIAHPGSTTGVERLPTDPTLPGLRLVQTADVPWVEHLSREHYLRRWLTVSTFLAAEPSQLAAMIASVEAVLDDHPASRGRTDLRLPNRTWVEVYEVSDS